MYATRLPASRSRVSRASAVLGDHQAGPSTRAAHRPVVRYNANVSATRPDRPEIEPLARLANDEPQLAVFALFGSRARGEAAEGADWDLGYLAEGPLDVDALRGNVMDTLGTDRVDLVDLARASNLLRFRAARDGVLIHESRPGAFEDFQVEATLQWCDMEPVLRRAYDDVLDGLRELTLDRHLLAEKSAIVERHLRRVATRVPNDPSEMQPMTDATDAVILHLWQAVQVVLDIAASACVRLGLGSPGTYREAFDRLAGAGYLDGELAERLKGASGFRNIVAHAYEGIDLARVHRAAVDGPADLRAFLAAMADLSTG
jgi:uncharacterized protein YutE (UPF0331/DUF86 family)